MREHDTFDLDAAFAALERDVAGISSPPGADAAVATARRRRRTTIAAVAAVAVLAVGGTAIAQGVGAHDSAGEPTGRPPSAPLTARALSAATDGWLSGWTEQALQNADLQAGPVEHCLNAVPGSPDDAQPTRGSGNRVFSTGGADALAVLWGFDTITGADRTWASLTTTLRGCDGSTPSGAFTWNDAEARSYELTSSTKTEHAWVAREGTSVGVIWVSGEQTPAPAEADAGVAWMMVSALEDPVSMRTIPR